MNFKSLALISLLVLLFSHFLVAQTHTVFAKLRDADGNAVYGASVVVMTLPDSALLAGVLSDFDGKFSLQIPSDKTYLLKISYLGSEDLWKTLVATGSSSDLQTISLKQKASLLRQVTITDRIPPAKQLGDTTQFNAAAFKTNPDANVEDLLTKVPGLNMQNGKLQAQGEDVKQILVDGKPFFGDDPNVVLKNLPAEMIDKIQVFDKKSDQAQFSGIDDGNSQKTINIVTKVKFRNGQFGKAFAGAGDDGKYKTGASVNAFKEARKFTVLFQSNNINEQNFSADDLAGVASSSGGGGRGRGRRGGQSGDAGNFLTDTKNGISTTNALGLNYINTWNKLSFSSSYFYNQSATKATSSLQRNYFGDAKLSYNESALSENNNANHRVNFKLEYKIDSSKSIIFQPKFSLQQNTGFSNQNGQNFSENQLANSSSTLFSSGVNALSFSAPLLYRQSFQKKGRSFSVNINPTFSKQDGDSRLSAINAFYQDTSYSDTLLQDATQNKNSAGFSGKLNYSEPLYKNVFIQLGLSKDYTQSQTDKLTYDNTTNDAVLLNSLSNQFESVYQSQAASADLKFQNKKYDFTSGISYQVAKLSSEQELPAAFALQRTFISVLPNARFQFNLSPKRNLRLQYRSRNNAPSIDQLQTTVNNSNPLQLSVGNASLQQDQQNSLFLRYSDVNTDKASSLFFFLGATFTSNYLSNAVYTAAKDSIIDNGFVLQRGAQLSKPINIDGYQNYRAFFTYGFYVKAIRSNINLNANANYSVNPSIINGIVNSTSTQNSGAGLSVTSNVSEQVDFNVSTSSTVTTTLNPLLNNATTQYFNQTSRLKLNVMPNKRWVIQQELNHQYNTGLSDGINQNYLLWNAAIGYKFLKNNNGDLRLSVFDLLNKNTAVSRNVSETYLEDTRTNVLQRYFLLTFTYQFKYFKGSKEEPQ